MPPKKPAFKIKASVKDEEMDDEDVMLSDFQLQRLKQQQEAAAQFTKDQLDEKHKAVAVSRTVDMRAEVPVNKEAERKATLMAATGRTTTAATIGGSGVVTGGGRGEEFPVNTMDSILGGEGMETAPGIFRPIGVRSATGTHATADDNSSHGVRDGTAFLREAAKEQAEINALNQEYFKEAETKYEDELMYVQLPRPAPGHEGDFNLAQMAPGKIGKLLVYKSGKTVLKVGDSSCEFNVEGGRGASAGGFSQYVVTIDPKEVSDRACYQLGWVPRKVVCTPLLDE